jgi:hypothetical protein
MRGLRIGLCAALVVLGCDKGQGTSGVGGAGVDIDAAEALVAVARGELDQALAKKSAQRAPDVSASALPSSAPAWCASLAT